MRGQTNSQIAVTTGQYFDRDLTRPVRDLDPDERRTYTHQVITWARTMHADEITVAQRGHYGQHLHAIGQPGDNPATIRLWWD
ncbi:MAG TPA: hypothetical protein VGD67_21100 [Pseudonocardiaceae bacterium]